MKAPAKVSAGLLMCRRCAHGWEFLLVHPGGPFYTRKDDGVWTIPKGLAEPGEEDMLAVAKRELLEETGFSPEAERYLPLGEIRQKGGKRVIAWAFEGTCHPERLVSNTFELEWPPRSGKLKSFPEVDRAEFFELETAKRKMLEAQRPFLERALAALSA